MTGYGNRTAQDIDTTNSHHLSDHHDSTRLDRDDSHPYSDPHPAFGSGATGGAGFGNKSAPDPEHHDNSEFRFGIHDDGAPYSGHTEHGSGSTGGAGYGNKTGQFSERTDSTMGKLIEKAGHVLHKENLVEKGRAKREAQGISPGESSGQCLE